MTGPHLMKRNKVLRILHERRGELFERYGIVSLSLFGSVARDQAHAGSDVDLLVEFAHPVGLFQFIELQQHLESLLGCKVDLGTPCSLKTKLKEHVLKEAVPVT